MLSKIGPACKRAIPVGLLWLVIWAGAGRVATAQVGDVLPYVAPEGSFQQDSMLIGAPVVYSLSLRHPARMRVLFPDSSFPFAPFELRAKKFFPTRTQDTLSLDSATYELAYFGTEPSLELTLPITYLLPAGDSLPIYAPADTLHLRMLEPPTQRGGADSVLASVQLLPMQEQFNYPYWIIGLALVIGLLLVANVFLGGPLQRYFRLFLMARRHRFFIRAFDRMAVQIGQTHERPLMERALNLWKAYIERVEDRPYSTYSTKDFAVQLPDPSLLLALQSIDRVVYGGLAAEKEESAYATLRRFANRIYSQKRQAVRQS